MVNFLALWQCNFLTRPGNGLQNARTEQGRMTVERAFGVLQARFAIIQNPARIHCTALIKGICIAYVILHNKIVEDKREENLPQDWDQRRGTGSHGNLISTSDWIPYMAATRTINDSETHYMLRNDLVEHLWNLKGADHKLCQPSLECRSRLRCMSM